MNAFLYQPIFIGLTTLFAFVTVIRYFTSPDYRLQERQVSIWLPLIMCIAFVLWIGGRPISGAAFGDTANYALEYKAMEGAYVTVNWHSEWIWSFLMVLCGKFGLSVSTFFTIVAAGYFLTALWAVKRFLPKNPMVGMIFVLTSLMFFPFATNGLRNGLACHVMLLAMSYFFDDKYIKGALWCLVAFGLHRSVMLPIASMIAGRYVIKDMRYAILFWVFSIALSLVAGGSISGMFAAIGFDDRMSAYLTNQYQDQFSNTGFRWDFLIYSSFPILMGWYVCVKRAIRDDWYRTLCVSYCLCNAFWVMVIRAAFSNRFAYLSWFMYPMVIAYPLVNLPVWEDQDRKTAIILAMYSFFTLFMYTVVW